MKEIQRGNLLMAVCFAFYLLWWILAFKPEKAVKGMASGWLLIPAFIFGSTAVTQLVSGIRNTQIGTAFFPNKNILICGIAVYFILLAVTGILFKRMVTTELLLIVGWTALAFSEVNTLFGAGQFSRNMALTFFFVILLTAVSSLVCYMLYYNMGAFSGYIDGMIPLILVLAVMASLFLKLLNQ